MNWQSLLSRTSGSGILIGWFVVFEISLIHGCWCTSSFTLYFSWFYHPGSHSMTQAPKFFSFRIFYTAVLSFASCVWLVFYHSSMDFFRFLLGLGYMNYQGPSWYRVCPCIFNDFRVQWQRTRKTFWCLMESFSFAHGGMFSANYFVWHSAKVHPLWFSSKDHLHWTSLKDYSLQLCLCFNNAVNLSVFIIFGGLNVWWNGHQEPFHVHLLQHYKCCLLFCPEFDRGLHLCGLPFPTANVLDWCWRGSPWSFTFFI